MELNSDGLEFLRQLRAGVEQYKTIHIRKAAIRIRPLSIDEQVQVTSDVIEELKELPEHMQHKISEEVLMAKKIIQLATTSDVGQNDSPLTQYLLGRMSSNEIMAIYKEWLAWIDKINPELETMSKDDIMKLVDDLKKNPSALKDLSHGQRDLVITHLLNPDG